MTHDIVALLGTPSVELVSLAERAAAMASAKVMIEPTVDNLVDLIDGDRPIAVVASLSPRARHEVLALRARLPTAVIAVIGMTQQITGLRFEEAYAAGYDDVCAWDVNRLGRRLRQLAETGPMDVTPCGRRVVIADEDRTQRLMTGRVFRNAGFDVEFANDANEAMARGCKDDVYVAVVSAAIHGRGARGLSANAWLAGCKTPFIVTAPPRELGAIEASLERPKGARLAVHDSFATPETLLFVANDLVNRPAVEARKSERLLYGAAVRFRSAGRDNGDVGHLFNISGGGVYVRTLAPPPRGSDLWLEFTPPRCGRLVHLEGTAVWTRRYGPGTGATVPTGFGLQISGASPADAKVYREAYDTYLAERRAVRRGGPQSSTPRRKAPAA